MFTSFTCKERKTTCNRHPLLEDYYFTGVPYKLFGKLLKLVLDKGFLYTFKGPLQYLLRPLLGENEFAVTQHMYAYIAPNLDNIH